MFNQLKATGFIAALKLVLLLVVAGHIIYLVLGIFFDYLGPNPVEVLTHTTGEWGLHFLLIGLAITPARRHFHQGQLIKLRRFIGLCSFFYICLHFTVFIFFDHFFFWPSILEDILQRPYIAVGFASFVLMIPLAITSFKRLQQKLGKRWLYLHRSVYLVAILAIIHYWWLVKADILWPLIYAVICTLLLADRYYWRRKKMATNNVVAKKRSV